MADFPGTVPSAAEPHAEIDADDSLVVFSKRTDVTLVSGSYPSSGGFTLTETAAFANHPSKSLFMNVNTGEVFAYTKQNDDQIQVTAAQRGMGSTTPSAGSTSDVLRHLMFRNLGAWMNKQADELVAVMATLGVNPQGSDSDVAARFSNLNKAKFTRFNLGTSDVEFDNSGSPLGDPDLSSAVRGTISHMVAFQLFLDLATDRMAMFYASDPDSQFGMSFYDPSATYDVAWQYNDVDLFRYDVSLDRMSFNKSISHGLTFLSGSTDKSGMSLYAKNASSRNVMHCRNMDGNIISALPGIFEVIENKFNSPGDSDTLRFTQVIPSGSMVATGDSVNVIASGTMLDTSGAFKVRLKSANGGLTPVVIADVPAGASGAFLFRLNITVIALGLHTVATFIQDGQAAEVSFAQPGSANWESVSATDLEFLLTGSNSGSVVFTHAYLELVPYIN